MTFVSTPKNLLVQRFSPGVSTKRYLNRLGNNNRFFNRQVTKDQQKMRIEKTLLIYTQWLIIMNYITFSFSEEKKLPFFSFFLGASFLTFRYHFLLFGTISYLFVPFITFRYHLLPFCTIHYLLVPIVTCVYLLVL